MSQFGTITQTNKGKNLQAKVQTGAELKFTRIAAGDGKLNGASIIGLNALISEKKTLQITKLRSTNDGKAIVGTVLSNQDVTSGFYFREIGVFAQDPDFGEILYCYGNAGDLGEYIPAGGGPDVIEKIIDIFTVIGNATNITATIDVSLVYETQEGAQAKADVVTNWVKLFGLGDVAKDISSTDLNNLDMTGFYRGNNLTNPPSGTGSTWWYLINMKHSAIYKLQIAVAFGGNMYMRSNNNGTWSAWVRMATLDANGKMAIADLPAATTALAGIAQLVDSITDTSTTKAATANSVKLLADWVKSFGLGSSTKTLSMNADLNLLTDTGFYNVSTPTNAPEAGAYVWDILHFKSISTNYFSQYAMKYQSGVNKVFFRQSTGGTWSAWTQIETTAGAQTKADQAETNAVNFAKSFGLGDVAKDISNTDLNVLDSTGLYKGGNLTNSPSTTNNFFIIHFKSTATTKTQIIFRYVDNIPYIRYNNAGTWTSWIQLAQYDANGKIAVANLPDATTALKGIIQLADSISDTSTNKAATANSVKLLQDWVKGLGLGGNSSGLANGTDLNTLTVTGFYNVTAPTNAPETGAWNFNIIHIKNSNANYYTQYAYKHHNGFNKLFVRHCTGNVWEPWAQLETTDGAQAKADAVQTWVKSFGLGDSLSTSVDWNTLTATGFYAGSTNGPVGNAVYGVHLQRSGTLAIQMVASAADNKQWFRSYNGTWGAWKQLATTDQALPTGTTLAAATDWNTLTTQGTYKIDGITANSFANSPSGAYDYGMLMVLKASNSSDVITQMYIPDIAGSQGGMWVRTKYAAAAFRAWTKITPTDQENWTNLTLVNSWVSYGAPYATPGFRKNNFGEVELRGVIKSGVTTGGTIIATLPTGYRPTAQRTWVVGSYNGTSDVLARVSVDTAGNIFISSGSNALLSLDGIKFATT